MPKSLSYSKSKSRRSKKSSPRKRSLSLSPLRVKLGDWYRSIYNSLYKPSPNRKRLPRVRSSSRDIPPEK